MEQRRLSIVRLLILFGALAILAGGSFLWGKSAVKKSQARSNDMFAAPYVDATLTPILHFEDSSEVQANNVVLGFIVADSKDGCSPSWGTYYGLDAASRALDMDRRVANLKQRGGQAVVSFGGALNAELATACQDTDKLTSAYQAVIDRYSLKAIDFDIEGAALSNTDANARRSDAINRLQQQNKDLKVWLTVPVEPAGMNQPTTDMITQALTDKVDLAGINVMTMDYGNSKGPQTSMKEATQLALTSTWSQLDGLYKRAGTPKSEGELWAMIGATPMIGQNDVPDESFSLDDARWLNDYAHRMGMGRISFWSANRDAQCGGNSSNSYVSNTCSGVRQDAHQFTQILMDGGSGKPPVTNDSALAAAPVITPASRAQNLSHDDPRTSPYPLWRNSKEYDAGTKVVWQDRVYQAKWWNKDTQPDSPVTNTWDTPWRYLGPVLQSDRDAAAAAVPIAPSSERPQWSSEKVYVQGDEVEAYGRAYRAKWWTQGDLPQQDPDSPYDHPWQYLGDVVKPAATQAPPPPGFTPPPAATPSPVAKSESTGSTTRYTPDNSAIYIISSGDTLSNIAKRFGVPAQQIMSVNRNISDFDHLSIGDRLLIPLTSPGAVQLNNTTP